MSGKKMYFGDDKPTETERRRSFDEVSRALRSRALDVCGHLLPGGQQRGQEYVCGNINGGKGNSLSVNLRTGQWKDFATGDSGKDLVSLFAAAHSMTQVEGKQEAESWLGWETSEPAEGHIGRVVHDDTPEDIRNDQGWYRDLVGTEHSKRWDYFDSDGTWVVSVYRIVHPVTGKKTIRPFNQLTKRWESLEGDRPLLNLQDILRNPTKTVVMVEGEKCSDAIQELGDDHIGTSLMGGAQAISKTDFTPLEWRKIILWRDNDKAGKDWQEKILTALKDVNPEWVKVVTIPAGKPPKWDCADIEDLAERAELIEEAAHSRPLISGRRPLKVEDWGMAAFPDEEPPPREWLVNGTFPLATHVILAAAGDTGKGMMLLDLALKVAGGQPTWDGPVAFGGTVKTFGRVVIFSAEDSHDEVHRRLHSLDEGYALRKAAEGRLMIVPLPNAGGVRPLIRSSHRGLELTEEFEKIRDQLLSIEDLVFVVFDPLSTFVQADLNGDSAAAAFTAGQFANLAQETGATVLAAHHLKKIGKGGFDYDGALREAIRGQTAIVDGSRASYVLAHAPKKNAESALKRLHLPWKGDDWKNKVVFGEVVKCNAPADRSRKTYIRQENGLLVDRTTELVRNKKADDQDLDSLLLSCLAGAATRGFPFTFSGAGNGIFENNHLLPPSLRLPRTVIHEMTKKLLDSGKLKKCVAKGSAAQKWLDAPDGDFATGDGFRETGALPGAWWKEIGITEDETEQTT